MSWISNRFAKLRGVPKQQGAHVRGPVVPAPRSGKSLPDSGPSWADGQTCPTWSPPRWPRPVLVAASDDDVRSCWSVVARRARTCRSWVTPASRSARCAPRFVSDPDLIVVQVHSASDTQTELITAFKELSPQSKISPTPPCPGGAAVSAALLRAPIDTPSPGLRSRSFLQEIEALAAPGRTVAG